MNLFLSWRVSVSYKPQSCEDKGREAFNKKCGGCTHQNLQIYLLEDAWIKLCLVMNPQKIPEKKYLLKIIMEIIFEKLTSPKYNFSILCMVHLEHPSKN